MNFLRMIYHNLRYGAASTVIFIDNQVDAALAAMVRAILFVFLLITVGTIAGLFGFTRVAQYIYGISYFAGGFLSLILAARLGVLISVLPGIYNAVRGLVVQVTDPVPFMAPLNLPELLSNSTATFIYRILWATLATLQLVGCFAVVFPVYNNPLSFLVVLGAGWSITYGALIVGVGGEWLKRYGYMNVGIGVLMILFYALTFPFPNIWINFNTRWDGLWTSFSVMESWAQVNYWVALLYFVIAMGLLISLVYTILKKGKGVAVFVGFMVAFLFMVILGPRTVTAVGSIPTGFGSRNETGSVGSTTGTPQTSDSGKQASSVSGSRTFRVPANQQWFDTGLNVSGRRVRINVLDGQWKNAPTSGTNAGEGRSPYSEQSQLIVPSAPLSSLVAKTSNRSFYVGNQFEGTPGNGTLKLALNDKEGYYQDNSGSLTVEVIVLN